MNKSENAAEYWKSGLNIPVQNSDGLVTDVKDIIQDRSVLSLEGKRVFNIITNQNVQEFDIRELFLKIKRVELLIQRYVRRRLSGSQEGVIH